MFRRLRWLLMFFIVFVVGAVDVAALEHADTDTYFNTGRVNGRIIAESDKVKVDSIISNEYSFVFGDDYTSTIPSGIKGIEKEELSRMLLDESASKYVAKASDIEKGKFSNTYVNVGTYKGKKVDVKLTVMGFATFNGPFDTTNTYPNAENPYIAFYNENSVNSSNNTNTPTVKYIGLYTSSISWVEVKYEFFESGTNKPISVKGHTTYWNFGDWQGVHFLNNNTGLHGIEDSKLYYSDIGSKPFIYTSGNPSENIYDSRYTIAETFEGTSMTRVYSFTFPMTGDNNTIGGANGKVVHRSAVPYGLKSYASDTTSGADGSEVKVGDKIKYQIQVVGDVPEELIGEPMSNKNMKDYSIVLLDNEEDGKSKLSIKDNLSKGLKYVEGSSKFITMKFSASHEGSIEDPEIIVTDDGTTLNWSNASLPSGNVAILTYEVEVTSDAVSKVSNSATAVITNNCSGDSELPANTIESLEDTDNNCVKEKKLTLNKLVNPLFNEKEEEPVSDSKKESSSGKRVIKVPNTGSVIALSSIIGGFALIVGGSYMLYRGYKNEKK